jgi:hypothetical protein
VQVIDKSFDREQIGNKLLEVTGNEDLKIYFQDFKYIPVTLDWLQQYVQWWEGAKVTFGINYRGEQFDCENFARLFKALGDVTILGLNRKEAASLGIGSLLVLPKKEFGGIGPEDGTHVLNIVGTDMGWFVVEPQTGAIIELGKYPNLKTIIGANFG